MSEKIRDVLHDVMPDNPAIITVRDGLRAADHMIAALRRHGFVIVPVKPTDDMVQAFYEVFETCQPDGSDTPFEKAYAAMLERINN